MLPHTRTEPPDTPPHNRHTERLLTELPVRVACGLPGEGLLAVPTPRPPLLTICRTKCLTRPCPTAPLPVIPPDMARSRIVVGFKIASLSRGSGLDVSGKEFAEDF